jgi:hypothetical protein
VSAPKGPAFKKLLPKVEAGATLVARATKSLTSTIKALPPFSTDPLRISDLFGPTRGKPQDARTLTITKSMSAFAKDAVVDFTTRLLDLSGLF